MPAHTPHPQYRVPLTTVSTRIDNAAHTAHRNPADITLLLATKTQPTPTITDAIHTYRHLVTTQQITNRPLAIGENRVQELSNKAADLSSLRLSAHLIGPLQSNKINHTLTALAHHADAWVDSVSTPQLATKLNDRWSHTHPLNVLIQINVSGAPTQHGCPPSDALTLANHIHTLPTSSYGDSWQSGPAPPTKPFYATATTVLPPSVMPRSPRDTSTPHTSPWG